MSFIGSLFGLGKKGGGAGLNFNAQGIPIEQGVDTTQTANAYDQTQQGLQGQQNFLQALQAQNGLQNQSSVFNQQQALANQYQGIANGTGPNPALQQLQNTTGQNVANQAALMAGQRGSGANAGLMARQAAMQGGNIQQQAAGQGAALSAQQQLAAMGALQNQQSMMGNMANQQIGQYGAAQNAYNQSAQNEQGQLLNALGQYNSSRVNQQNAINASNAGVSGKAAEGQQGMLGGIMSGISGALGFAKGGMIRNYDRGGEVLNLPQNTPHLDSFDFGDSSSQMGPQSSVGKILQGGGTNFGLANVVDAPPSTPGVFENRSSDNNSGSKSLYKGMDSTIGNATRVIMDTMQQGGRVPGKALVRGDSLKNDTVPAMLSPGEIVIPKHVMESSDPISNSAKFVQAVLAKNGMRKK